MEHKSSLVETPVGMIKIGMYVAEIDRPWLETPFATQGFAITSEEDIDFVAAHCQYVYVDPQLTQHESITKKRFQAKTTNSTSRLRKEIVASREDLNKATIAMDQVFKGLRSQQAIKANQVEDAVRPLVENVLKRGEALAALMRMRAKSDYLMNHAMAVTIWATMVGRHMSYSREELNVLAMGATLADVGMANLPSHILQKEEPLSREEEQLVRSHVRSSVRIAEESGISDHRIIEIISAHHERHSGAGYPNHQSEKEIPINARIVGIADTYDAMTSRRPYREAYSSFEAISQLNAAKDILFQSHLVDAFTQMIGIFPSGALVELSSGEVAIVMSQNPHRRLQPEIMIVLDSAKKPYPSFVSENLAKLNSKLSIKRELQPGSFGIEAENFFL